MGWALDVGGTWALDVGGTWALDVGAGACVVGG